MENGTPLAAIDLGSNSFRMELGRLEHGQILPSDYLKETVRLGAGLDGERVLSEEAMQRGFDCLARFAERLHSFAPAQVRAVATQTLREAVNRDVFLTRAQQQLGFPIEVISGREEARLIYSGVSHLLPQSQEKRLVIDIGGRSTEIILGQGYAPKQADSFRVGSVSHSMKFFADGRFSSKAFDLAKVAAMAVLDEALGYVTPGAWEVAYGSSGTVGALLDLIEAQEGKPGPVTPARLQALLDRLLKAGSADRLRMPGLKEDRKPVIGGGLAVVLALFELFDLRELHGAKGALRHGVLYDLISRERHDTDARSQTVQRLQHAFGVDLEQAARVRKVALALHGQLTGHDATLSAPAQTPSPIHELHQELGWAADLHEIGMLVSHASYHHHGAYILQHADAPGFSEQQLVRLGRLLLLQRGRLKKVETDLEPLDDTFQTAFTQAALALRLAVLLCHARRAPKMDGLQLRHVKHTGITLEVHADWARQHPQSMVLLQDEADVWRKTPTPLILAEA